MNNARLKKKHKDKLLRQMHTYTVCSQKPITMLTYISNARLGKTHRDKPLRQMHTYIVCSQNPITNAQIHKQCTVKNHTDKLLRQTKANYKC